MPKTLFVGSTKAGQTRVEDSPFYGTIPNPSVQKEGILTIAVADDGAITPGAFFPSKCSFKSAAAFAAASDVSLASASSPQAWRYPATSCFPSTATTSEDLLVSLDQLMRADDRFASAAPSAQL